MRKSILILAAVWAAVFCFCLGMAFYEVMPIGKENKIVACELTKNQGQMYLNHCEWIKR